MTGLNNNFLKIMFLVLFSFTYPFLFYSFVVEQYVPATFILIFVLYLYYYRKRQNNWLLALSSGVILTNAVIVPIVTYTKNVKDWVYSIIKIIAAFLALCVLSGKLSSLYDGFDVTLSHLGYTPETGFASVSIIDKLYNFIHFIEICFIAPEYEVIGRTLLLVTPIWITSPEYEIIGRTILPAATTGISWFGIALLFISIVSVIINRKILLARICGLWVLFSVVIFLIIGFGIGGGYVIFTLYFSWAHFVLAFLFVDKVFNKIKIVKCAIYSSALVVMMIINIYGMAEIIKFGVHYWPVK